MTQTKTTRVAGAKVTINPDAPAAAMMAKAEFLVTDERGRGILLRKPDVLAQFKLVEALGDAASNQVFMGMVFPLLFVAQIDGEPVARPNSRGEVDALIKRLDEDGYQAVALGMQEHFAPVSEDAAKND